MAKLCRLVAWLSLAACAVMAVATFRGGDLDTLKTWLIVPSLIYLVSATVWIQSKEQRA